MARIIVQPLQKRTSPVFAAQHFVEAGLQKRMLFHHYDQNPCSALIQLFNSQLQNSYILAIGQLGMARTHLR